MKLLKKEEYLRIFSLIRKECENHGIYYEEMIKHYCNYKNVLFNLKDVSSYAICSGKTNIPKQEKIHNKCIRINDFLLFKMLQIMKPDGQQNELVFILERNHFAVSFIEK